MHLDSALNFVQRLDANSSSFALDIASLRKRLSPDGSVVSERGRQLTICVFGEPLSPQQVVERICNDVRARGTEAVLHYSRAFDDPTTCSEKLRVPLSLMRKAHEQASEEFLAAIRRIRQNIVAFQAAILHKDVAIQPLPGVSLAQQYTPLHRVGICVPGGAAAYPSTVLMTAIPAQCAGVSEIAIMAPPTPLGAYNQDMLAVCYELGLQELYAVGGAHGVASLAYGIAEIPAVDKIVGPGNLFVALAKRFVYGQVDIDSIAGPSEVVVIADESTRPDFAASDMLAQAEHSPGSSVCVSCNANILDRIEMAMAQQLKSLERSQLTLQSLMDFGAFILCRDENHVCEVTSLLAPEHLQIATDHPRRFLNRIKNCGAIFLGHYSPVALGDYAAGPSHVLPTGGTARWASGLSANHFLRSSSLIEFNEDALQNIAPAIELMATKEGLTAHRKSVQTRFLASE